MINNESKDESDFELLVGANFVKKEDINFYVGVGMNINFRTSGMNIILPIGMIIRPFDYKKLAVSMELYPLLIWPIE